ncbi:MAG: hypothetical protein LBN00_07505, partial [Oscillospiraceae bacterium]|nr:hypothetical protein [Oscillospiraceae bacterium]
MLFLKIDVETKTTLVPEERDDFNDFARAFHGVSDTFYRNSNKEQFLFVSDIKHEWVTLGAFCKNGEPSWNEVCVFFELAKIAKDAIVETRAQEVTFHTMTQMLRTADRRDFIQDDDETLEQIGLDGLRNVRSFNEEFCTDASKETLLKRVRKLLCEELFIPEIERIFAGDKLDKRMGHPVHYLIQTDDTKVRKKLTETLVSALHTNRRVGNSRYSEISFSANNSIESSYEKLYAANTDGVIAVYYGAGDTDDDEEYANRGLDVITGICDAMRKHKNDVLTILCLPRSCEKVKDMFKERLGVMTLVELNEDTVFGEKAKTYLRSLAAEHKVKTDRTLYKGITDAGKGYLAADLNRVFDEWFDKKLRTQVYSQYAELETVNKQIAEKKPRGSAFAEL